MPAYVLKLINTTVLIRARIKILPVKSLKLISAKERLYLIKKAREMEAEQITKSNKKIIQRGTMFIL
jgi:hypothetical protein